MQQKYISSLLWVLRLQWQASRLAMVWSIFYSAFTGIKPILSAFALAKLIATVSAAALQDGSPTSVYLWLAALLGIELISQLLNSIDRITRLHLQHKMELATNEQFFIKMYSLSQEQFDDEAFNTKLDRARDALMQIWRVVDELSWAISQMISFAGSILAILIVAPVIGLLIILTVIPVAFVQVRQNRIREEVYKKSEPFDRVAYRTRWLLIDPNSMPEVRLMNGFKKMLGAYIKNMKKSQNLMYRSEKKLVKYDVTSELIQPTVSFGANIYFFNLLLAGTIGLDRFMFLRGMLEQAVSSAGTIGNSVQRLHELSINLGNFSEVYNTPPAIPDGHIKVERPVTIEFRNVSFSYPGSDEQILKDISFVIHPGSKIALVGENGAGKSTLIKLLLRQYLPSSGSIIVNGFNIIELELESYYAVISNLSQEFLIVNHLPIRDNLLIGLSDQISDEEIYQVTDLVDATSFIKKLPHQLGTRLDTSFDDGSNLSGGQRQRLVVARALLRNGDMLILDEPTSAIDAKAEYTIFSNIYNAHAGKTTLIVSHRFSTVRKADSIIVLDDGEIAEYGSHEELLRHDGLYKEMFETQAEGYK